MHVAYRFETLIWNPQK